MEEGTTMESSSSSSSCEKNNVNSTTRRLSLKSDSEFSNYQFWKQKLRENCLKRVREDRTRLLWKCRSSSPPTSHQDHLDIAFRDIVSHEFHQIIKQHNHDDDNDLLWNDQSPHTTYQEELLLQMQDIFYQETAIDTWEDEVDNYLARAVYDHMDLNADKTHREQIWCPVCKQGDLKDTHTLIYCTRCKLQLTKAGEVTLDFLHDRLAEAHTDHFDRGCRLKPTFCIKTEFNLTALYIMCEGCDTFEVVI
ncbi:RPA-interacting protein isoform X1 [Trifolium pratense]|uniref:RPA-interacting protein isoform X1 n=1 Tax=Trifolium pratense TaxID=57577 RepID=UPI001E6932B3|nr:RPA-interacting protein isoform X1 [Trifolium pratense]